MRGVHARVRRHCAVVCQTALLSNYSFSRYLTRPDALKKAATLSAIAVVEPSDVVRGAGELEALARETQVRARVASTAPSAAMIIITA